jgi:hypothetical protein
MSLALLLCLLSFVLCLWAGRQALVNGLIAVIGVGYVYGILRANIPETYSHFIFDAAVAGLYVSQISHRLTITEKYRVEKLKPWLELLIAWPILIFFLPLQDWLVQFVGLRGSIFLLPFIFLGARMSSEDRYRLALWLAGFNVAVCVLGGVEYFWGIQSFFPRNDVTELMYRSTVFKDQLDLRIPASFANAHAYGGTMVVTLPLLAGAVMQKRGKVIYLVLLTTGILAALLGVFMSAARTHFIAAAILVLVTTVSLRFRPGHVLAGLILIAAVAWIVSGENRLQRFLELRDTDAVVERVSISVNMGFFEAAARYPFGNGLGGGGTSIPYFLQDRIKNPTVMENEYARIMLEEGIVGLAFWAAFVVWVITRPRAGANHSWSLGRRLARVSCIVFFLSGLTGIGLLTSIPFTALFLLLVGWTASPEILSGKLSVVRQFDFEKPALVQPIQ